MPIVPRNTQTAVRINPIPGVRSINPQGAEGIGAQASAMGHQAAVLGAQANAEADHAGAVANVFDSIGGAAVTVDRVQRIREGRQIDEAMALYKNDIGRTAYGFTDAQGNHVPGTMEAPYMPADGASEPSGATHATAKAHTEWMTREDSPYARLSPRAQEAFRRQVTEVYRPIEQAANAKDAENYRARIKMVDEANLTASFALLSKTAGDLDSPAWSAAAGSARTQYAMQATSHMQADPANRMPDQAQWLTQAGETVYRQKLREFDEKAAGQRVQTLLQMAEAVPVGTPEADAQAKQLIDYASKFASEWTADGTDPVMTPEAIAKAQQAAQAITRERERRTSELRSVNLTEAKVTAANVARGFEKDPAKLPAAMAKLPPTERAAVERFMTDAKAADEKYLFDNDFNNYLLTEGGDFDNKDMEKALKDRIGSLSTTEARAYAHEQILKHAEDKARVQKAEDKEIAKRNRSLALAHLESGGIFTQAGEFVMQDPYELLDLAKDFVRKRWIASSDYYKFKSELSNKVVEPRIAEDVLNQFASRLGDDNIRAIYEYKSESDTFDIRRREKDGKANFVIQPSDLVGSKKMRLTADLLRQAMNTAAQYGMQAKMSGKEPPKPLADVIDAILDPGTNPTAKALYEQTVTDNIDEAQGLIRDISAFLASEEMKAISEGLQKGNIDDAND